MCNNSNQPVPIQKEVKPLLTKSDISETYDHCHIKRHLSPKRAHKEVKFHYAIHMCKILWLQVTHVTML